MTPNSRFRGHRIAGQRNFNISKTKTPIQVSKFSADQSPIQSPVRITKKTLREIIEKVAGPKRRNLNYIIDA